MRSEKVIINNTGDDFDTLLRSVEKYTADLGLERKPALHLRLLAEETIGMVRSMTGDFTAYFWIEQKRDLHTLNLEGKLKIDATEREKLLSVAKSGGNILAKGIMGKIKDIIEIGTLSYKEAESSEVFDYAMVLPVYADRAISPGMDLGMTEQFWSLQSYRQGVKEAETVHEEPQEIRELLDELEQSIVANLAEDVQVGVLDGKFKMKISYREK